MTTFTADDAELAIDLLTEEATRDIPFDNLSQFETDCRNAGSRVRGRFAPILRLQAIAPSGGNPTAGDPAAARLAGRVHDAFEAHRDGTHAL